MTDKLREAAQLAEREAFEAWGKTQGTVEQGWWFRQLPDGGYSAGNPDAAWKAWQARAALAQQDARQGVDWEKLYRLEVKKKEALAAKYERDIKPLTKIVPLAQTAQQDAQVVPLGWQPIETAPKDGRTVIIGRHMNEFGFVRGYGRFEGEPGSFCSGWISQGFDEVLGNLGLAHPTHWMPLPAPPDAAPTPPAQSVIPPAKFSGLTDDDWQEIAEKSRCIIWSALKQAVNDKLLDDKAGKNEGGAS